uniref:Phosphate-selective porin O and P n=1 Tax=Candidatus Kentrum sp. LFY TaxID=2126342 RepID=A0A450WQC7_9GAMM|nr:MAG: hypothetical protein BECKLFY1418C_GA0070996_105523 [Candidatus Kentron sp. LFY]
MHTKTILSTLLTGLLAASPVLASDDVELLRQQLDMLRKEYGQRIALLENRLQQAEEKVQEANAKTQALAASAQAPVVRGPVTRSTASAGNVFNPDISLILDGRYADFGNGPDAYELPGFALGGEAGLGGKGFAVGHTELTASANIDDKFYGQATLAVHEHDGETKVELEEAFIQTLGLGHGFTIKGGRFFSGLGYLNEQHEHAWDFADAPLIYRGLFGNQLRDDGLQVTYVAPTDTFVQLGAEVLSGSRFPAGGEHGDAGAWTAFANIGGDIGVEHSWLLGLSHWQADDVEGRTSGGHSHDGAAETPSFTGQSEIDALDFVYKWAPNGNPKNRNFKFQAEYLLRREEGTVTMTGSSPLESTRYDGRQEGWYAQAAYQFLPQWRTGIRYDWLDSDNTGSDGDVLAEAGLDNEGHNPERYSAMLEWLPSEFSRIRLQYNRDESYEDADNQVIVQYTHSLGSHGAHQF